MESMLTEFPLLSPNKPIDTIINMRLLEDWNKVITEHSAKTNELLSNCKKISRDYDKSKENMSDIGFNVFKITSDLYYRENFHSDVIKALLDPEEKHFQNTKYLYLFFKLINKSKSSIVIDEDDYKNTKVGREQSRIDILITDASSKRAIIIENKINNAIDPNRQLPRYYNKVKKDYQIDAIVYLTLDSSKRPDRIDWTEEELLSIEKLLVIIPSFDRSGRPSLYNDWLLPSIIETNDIDSSYLLRQYANLLKFLNTNNMDTVSLEKFYETLKEVDNLKTAFSIRNMLNDLPKYLAQRIEDKYKNNYYPFQDIWKNKEKDVVVFEAFKIEELYLKLNVLCSDLGYELIFWNPKNENYDIKDDFENFEIFKNWEYRGCKNHITRNFLLFEEDLLFEFIDELLAILKQKLLNG
jgi:hypothetical protein